MSNKDSYKEYLEDLNKIKNEVYHYTIDGKDVTEEEFKKFIRDKIKEKFENYENDRNTKENNL